MSDVGTLTAPASRHDADDSLDEILRHDRVRAFFQPVVELDTGALLGFEALARGPRDSALQRPDQLFGAARQEGRLAELDRACQRAAVNGARRHGIEGPLTLFVNTEPDTVGLGPLPPIGRRVRGIVELTERNMTRRLPELLPAVRRARSDGWGVALDDVGADASSLALMPVLRPDVIKLDLRLVQATPTPEIAAIVGAVSAEAERTGAIVLAEGIETAEQVRHARGLGATVGQGYFFGRPALRPQRGDPADTPLPISTAAMPHPWRTPFDLASARHPIRQGATPLLNAISRDLERQAASCSHSTLLISSYADVRGLRIRIGAATKQLAGSAGPAVGPPRAPASGLRVTPIADDDPLHGTWNVLVIGAHFTAMLAGRARGRTSRASDRQFDFVLTHERDAIVECAQALMLRIADADAGNRDDD